MIIPLRKSPVALALLCALPAADAAAKQQGLRLRMQTTVIGVPENTPDATAPMFMEADRIQGYAERETEATGNARARSRGQAFSADWMRFDHRINELTARGNVHLEQGAYVADGVRLRYELDSERGEMESARYALNPRVTGNLPIIGAAPPAFNGRGTAERILFEGPGVFRARQANFTTCEPGDNAWNIKSSDLQIYQEKGVGVARNARLEIKDIPVFYTPYFSFPLHQERKSGFLAPRYGTSSSSGFEVSVPYFWNLAPNYDLTVTPRVLSKRGVQLRNDFRYLMPEYRGELNYEVLPDDRVADRSRQLVSLRHTHALGYGWNGALDLTKVSDGKYFTDLSTRVGLTSRTYLTRQGSLSRGGTWGDGGTYAFNAIVQGWQTLQTDPAAPLTPPYSRRPQLTLTAQRLETLRGDFGFEGSYTDFDHPTLVRGRRWVAYPSMTFPMQTAAAFLTPKIGLHLSRYYIDSQTSTLPDASRVLPIFSTLTGLNFERSTRLFGNAFTQTLEPTAYYVYVPYRDQSQLPNFDSALQDVNFASIFSENRFSGNDRINDAHQVTVGVRSRLIHPDTGVESLRAAVAYRHSLREQRVSLPGTAAPNDKGARSDLLAAVSGTIAPHLTLDAGWQYDVDNQQTLRTTLSTRYQPQQDKLLNLAFRQSTSASIRQVDASVQWPVAQHWNVIGRWNYSIQDKRTLEALAGVEYDGGCFVFRVVGHRLSTATSATNTSIFVELELNGVARVGSNSLDLLRRNVVGYTRHDPHATRPNEYFVPER